MDKGYFLFFLFIFSISFISASCSDGEIDINSASLEELDKLVWIGEVTAKLIIDMRPFSSIDDLINVKGIGEKKLSDIKNQGLACVDKSNNNEEDSDKEDKDENEEENKDETQKSINITKEIPKNKSVQLEIIKVNPVTALNTKDIKSDKITKLDKNKLAKYGLIGFSILLVVLFIFKKKRDNKNEFR